MPSLSTSRVGVWHQLMAAVALVVLVGPAGCRPSGPKVVPISGIATRGGKPVADIELTFHPDTGRPSWGKTDAAGRFSLDYSRDRDGAVVGRHRVTVRGRQPASPEEEFAGKIQHPPEVREIVARFGDVAKTPLVIEITAARSDLEVRLD